MESQNIRKCPHGAITFGDASKCDKCMIESLKHELVKQVNENRELLTNNKKLNQLNWNLSDLANQQENYLNQHLIIIITNEIRIRFIEYYTLFLAEMLRIKGCTRLKTYAIMKRLLRLKQAIFK